MKQQSLSATGLELSPKRIRKCEFLEKTGLPPFEVKAMLRVDFMRHWLGPSDRAMKDALYDVPLCCQVAQLDVGTSRLPDESIARCFRCLLEEHALVQRIMAAIDATLPSKGLMLKAGTVEDATLIAASSSTKNKDNERDPEMQQNHGPSHGEESVVFADVGHRSAARGKEGKGTRLDWQVAMRPGKRRAQKKTPFSQSTEQGEELKAHVRVKVEDLSRVIKCRLGRTNLRYRGLLKNQTQLVTSFPSSNLCTIRRASYAGDVRGWERPRYWQGPTNRPQRARKARALWETQR